MFTNVLRSVFAFFFGREFDVIVEHASVGKETENENPSSHVIFLLLVVKNHENHGTSHDVPDFLIVEVRSTYTS